MFYPARWWWQIIQILIFQDWAVHLDKDILLPTPRHSVHQGMRDMGEDLQEPRDTAITPDKVLHLLGEDNTTRGLVLQQPATTCTTEGGVGVVTTHGRVAR